MSALNLALYQWGLGLTVLLLAALMTLGAGLQFRLWRTPRFYHHALFFAVVVGILASTLLAYLAGQPWLTLIPALALLLTMPRTKAGTRAHWGLALACAGALGIAVAAIW